MLKMHEYLSKDFLLNLILNIKEKVVIILNRKILTNL